MTCQLACNDDQLGPIVQWLPAAHYVPASSRSPQRYYLRRGLSIQVPHITCITGSSSLPTSVYPTRSEFNWATKPASLQLITALYECRIIKSMHCIHLRFVILYCRLQNLILKDTIQSLVTASVPFKILIPMSRS